MLPDALFLDEAIANLDAMDVELGRLDADVDPEAVHSVFRRAHSVKGGAAAFGLDAVADLMHRVESVLDVVRKAGIPPDRPTINLLCEAVCSARQMLAQDAPADAPAMQKLLDRLRERARDSDAPLGGRLRRIAIRSSETDVVSAAVTGLFSDIAGLGELLSVERRNAEEQVFTVRAVVGDQELLDLLAMHVDPCHVTIRAPSKPAAAKLAPREQVGAPVVVGASVRVDAAELRRLVQLARSLAGDAGSGEHAAIRVGAPDMAGLSEPVMGQWKGAAGALRQGLENLASAPLSTAFGRLPMLIQRLSERLNKRFSLSVHGDETRVDQVILQRLADPLMHLVRNACDHGIELPQQRLAMGKPADGRIDVSAWMESGWLRISVRDDGAGLSRENVSQAARLRGISVPCGLDDHDVWQLIFAPGLSTVASTNDVSGRGVGMDVVRRQIVAMGGEVSITSSADKGACVTMAIPLDDVY